jgi:outer membrane protein assembly factor BamB
MPTISNRMKQMMTTMGLVSMCMALTGPNGALADDWPQWNGRNRDGKSADTGLLAQWPAEGPKLAWKAAGFGGGYSSISVVGNHLYTMGDKSGDGWLMAAGAAGGKILWSTKIGAPGAPGVPGYDFPGPRSTPTVDGALIFVLDAWGDLVCVNAADGKPQWRKSLVKDLGGTPPTWGYSESPLVDGEQVVVTPGGAKGAVAAFNKKTGQLLWQSKEFTDAAQYSSIIPTEIDGARQYVQLTSASVAGVAADDGALLWQAWRRGNVAVIPTPLVAGNEIYVTSGYGAGCNLFKVTKADGKFSAEQVYANHVMVNHHGGVVRVGDYIYGYSDGKGLTCQNARTGAALWAEKTKIRKGSVSYADGRLYCREEDSGAVILVDAAPNGYVEKGRFDQPERTEAKAWPHPVIANGKLYLRDQDLLLCYDLKAAP